MNNKFLAGVSRLVFIVLLLSYIFLSFLEELKKGVVSNYLNLNWLFLGILLSAFFLFLWGEEEIELKKKKTSWFWFLLVSLIMSGLVWFETLSFPLDFFWHFFLAFFSGLTTLGILLIIFGE
jgi:hypothetical protein